MSYPGIDPTRGEYKAELCESKDGLNLSRGADTVPRWRGLARRAARNSLPKMEQGRLQRTASLKAIEEADGGDGGSGDWGGVEAK